MDEMKKAQLVANNLDSIRKGVYGFLTRVHDTSKAEDLIQDTCMALMGRKGDLYDADRSAESTYTRMIAWQTARGAYRTIMRGQGETGAYAGDHSTAIVDSEQEYGENQDGTARANGHVPADSTNAFDLLCERYDREIAEELLADLSDSDRELLDPDCNIEDYAERHGVSVGTAYTRKSRLLAMLRAKAAS
jgi:DNA-directed RNA polymerase specialized sigma24 family protein